MAKKKDHSELNESQKRFCKEYIYDWNATRAYQQAYNKDKNDYFAAAAAASRLLKIGKIQDYIKELQSDLEKVSGLSKLRLLEEYKKIAFTSIADMHNTWIERKQFEELTPDQKAAISSIETQLKTTRDADGHLRENEYVKVKLHDKNKAMEAIRKMLGHDELNELEGNLTVKIVRE